VAYVLGLSFASHTVTVIRPARVLDHGSWVDDWEHPAEHAVTGCVVFPGVSVEDNFRQDAQQVTYTVIAPAGSDVKAGDRVRVDIEPELDLAVYGRPRPIRSPTGALDHLHFELSDWEVV
jgi:hypothetical protein